VVCRRFQWFQPGAISTERNQPRIVTAHYGAAAYAVNGMPFQALMSSVVNEKRQTIGLQRQRANFLRDVIYFLHE
jgi:hypothetical protein